MPVGTPSTSTATVSEKQPRCVHTCVDAARTVLIPVYYFLATGFLTTNFLVTGFLTPNFFATGFLTTNFLAAGFTAVLATVFLMTGFAPTLTVFLATGTTFFTAFFGTRTTTFFT